MIVNLLCLKISIILINGLIYHQNFGGRKMDLEIIHYIADNLIQGIAIQYQFNYFI